jgi:hypothetical protein
MHSELIYKGLGLAAVHDRDNRLAELVINLEGEQVLDVRLDLCIVEPAADEALDAEHGVGGIFRGLAFGGVSNKGPGAGERDIGGGSTVALVVGDDFYSTVSPDSDAAVGRWITAIDREQETTYEQVVPRSIPIAIVDIVNTYLLCKYSIIIHQGQG